MIASKPGLLLLVCFPVATLAWVTRAPLAASHPSTRHPQRVPMRLFAEEEKKEFSIFDALSPYPDSEIPPDIRQEIYRAEANTPAAQGRIKRVAGYALLALIAIFGGLFNVILADLREEVPLADTDFAWVESNFVTSFLFINKLGGGLCILLGAGCGLLAEAELDSKRINSDKIYKELVRRKEEKTKKSDKEESRKSRRKKKMSGRERQRLAALSEVREAANVKAEVEEAKETPTETAKSEVPEENKKEEKKGGIFGSVQNLYERADAMAASQALLLNKKLEDAGVVDKITDETGLKVIGKEAAAKAAKESKEDKE